MPVFIEGVKSGCPQCIRKLTDFFDSCLGPEIVSPIRVLGMPVCDLRKM